MTAPFVDPDTIDNPTANQPITPEWGDTVNDGLLTLAQPPMCVALLNSAQSLTNNTTTAINFNTETLDTDAFHSTVSNTSRITVPSGLGGWYVVGAGITYATNGTGNRVLQVRVNGTTAMEGTTWTGTVSSSNTIGGIPVLLNAGDYVEFLAYQNSGSGLNITAARGWVRMAAWS